MTMNRRTFLKFLGLAGGAAAAGAVIANADRLETALFGGAYRVSETRMALGTHVDIVAVGPSRYETEDAVQAAFDEVMTMQNLLTRYDQQSPVCELNAEHKSLLVPDALASLFETCDAYYRDTNGAFDISVAPILDAVKSSAQLGRSVSEAELAELVQHVGADKLQYRDRKLLVPEGMKLTFDGCAPGFIADRAANILSAHHVEHFMVNAGGEIRTSGHPKNSDQWRIAIQDPSKQGNYPGVLSFNQGAVSTSGNYEIYFGEDKVFHHIIDARTGHSPSTLASVTVTAPTALEADILSTALFVMEPQEALAYVARRPHVACLLIDRDGRQIKSPNFVMG